jgi:hypothetical protein
MDESSIRHLIRWKLGQFTDRDNGEMQREWDRNLGNPEFVRYVEIINNRISEDIRYRKEFLQYITQEEMISKFLEPFGPEHRFQIYGTAISKMLDVASPSDQSIEKFQTEFEKNKSSLTEVGNLVFLRVKKFFSVDSSAFAIVDDALSIPLKQTTSAADQGHLTQSAKENPSQSVSNPISRAPINVTTRSSQSPMQPAPAQTTTHAQPSSATSENAKLSPKPIPLAPVTPMVAQAASAWKELPLPDHEPDPHSAYDNRSKTSPGKMQIIGARVRGKKHKHEGTHCDDWFEIGVSGDWTILAVADGAGSKKFSRVGSKSACLEAVQFLSKHLAEHRIEHREEWKEEAFQERDLAQVSQFMVEAVQAAWMAVVQAANKRLSGALGADDPYTKVLGRPLNHGDFSTTLLLAVHTTVMRGGAPISLVFGCGVGDGMIAGIGSKGETRLLMTADSGAHSGETRFLDERETAPEKLKSRVYPFLGSLRALMLMTDGVADDYFPNDPGMSHLYGDLLLNGIISSKISVNQEKETAPLALEKVTEESYMNRSEHTVIRSIKSIAEQLGKTPTEIWSNPNLLDYFAKGAPVCPSPDPSERLRLWLDNYHVRGSFDDRTLIAMYH